MTDRVFVDTNLWVYLFSKNPQEKYQIVRELVSDNFENIVISTQVLGELYHVLTRKNFVSKEEAKEVLLAIVSAFPALAVDTIKVIQALEVNAKYGYSYWDSLMIATALLSDCMILYSEDMQHNLIVENRMRIINPFVA